MIVAVSLTESSLAHQAGKCQQILNEALREALNRLMISNHVNSTIATGGIIYTPVSLSKRSRQWNHKTPP